MAAVTGRSKSGVSGAGQPESTLALLDRARAGDRNALESLAARYLPRLRRWATGRLPSRARDLADTSDLVQETIVQTFKNIRTLEARDEGALQAYLRQALLNRIRAEIRRAGRRPAIAELDSQLPTGGPSPLEAAIGRETVDRYERALAQLRPEDREAIVARLELGCDNEELARLMGKPSANAARMALQRALVKLADLMRRER